MAQHHLLEHRRHLVFVRDIGYDNVAEPAGRAQSRGCLRRFVGIASGQDHGGAGFRQALRHAQADAAVAACDQRHFSRQVEHGCSSFANC